MVGRFGTFPERSVLDLFLQLLGLHDAGCWQPATIELTFTLFICMQLCKLYRFPPSLIIMGCFVSNHDR